MESIVSKILQHQKFSIPKILILLNAENEDERLLYQKAREIKLLNTGDKVYLRGLIEFSNVCDKDCFYCGIRKSNKRIKRYFLSDEEVIKASRFAFSNKYGSIVLQSGEMKSEKFVERIERLVKQIRQITGDEFGITLSCGEQSKTTYLRWFKAGATRYLLRIETANENLYNKIHPNDRSHDFQSRVNSLAVLKKIGYQVGTGIMVGLPGQTLLHLAEDILFMKKLDIDMCGIGPFIEHHETPLFHHNNIWDLDSRFDLTLKVLAIIRIMMKNINIAASTALQSIDKFGREKAIQLAANVFMPNLTPVHYREDYSLYDNKSCVKESPDDCQICTTARIEMVNGNIAFGEPGDSTHYILRRSKV
jgi:biotin synthase